MFVVGITGPIGSGKSLVAHFFKTLHQEVIDADALSHQLCDEDESLKQEIIKLLGENAYDAQGKFQRNYVSEIVFKEKSKLDALSLLIHKAVVLYTQKRLAKAREEGKQLIFLDFPLPIQEGFLEEADFVLCLSASKEQRLERLEKRGLSKEKAEMRMAMQMSMEEYKALANEVLENDEDAEALKEKCNRFIQKELWVRGIRLPLLTKEEEKTYEK